MIGDIVEKTIKKMIEDNIIMKGKEKEVEIHLRGFGLRIIALTELDPYRNLTDELFYEGFHMEEEV